MNFISAFDELEKLYEAATPKVVNKRVDDLYSVMNGGQQVFAGTKEECEDWLESRKSPATARFKIVQGAEVPVKEACAKEELTEAADDEEIEIVDEEPVEEVPADEEVDVEVVDDENRQLIIECDKCGALVIINEADLVVDEKTDLVNVEDECKFCEETAGYKIVGVVAPYEVAEEVVNEEPVDEEPVDEVAEESETEDLTEAKTTKQRLTVIEPGYQYKDKDGSIYTLYGDECEEDDTGITYNWDYVEAEDGDIYIF